MKQSGSPTAPFTRCVPDFRWSEHPQMRTGLAAASEDALLLLFLKFETDPFYYISRADLEPAIMPHGRFVTGRSVQSSYT